MNWVFSNVPFWSRNKMQVINNILTDITGLIMSYSAIPKTNHGIYQPLVPPHWDNDIPSCWSASYNSQKHKCNNADLLKLIEKKLDNKLYFVYISDTITICLIMCYHFPFFMHISAYCSKPFKCGKGTATKKGCYTFTIMPYTRFISVKKMHFS